MSLIALSTLTLLAPVAALPCGPDSHPMDGTVYSCNEAGNVPNGDDFCHMSDLGWGDCTCDFTQGSGDPAYPGTVDCSCGGAYDPHTDTAVYTVMQQLAEAVYNALEHGDHDSMQICGAAGVSSGTMVNILRGDLRKVTLQDLVRVLAAMKQTVKVQAHPARQSAFRRHIARSQSTATSTTAANNR